MIKREQWGAKPLTAYSNKVSPSSRTKIVIHHSVTSEGTSRKAVEGILKRIDDQHRRNGWGGIGYNLVVDYAGRVYEARGINVLGAHAARSNTVAYGICYIGDGRKRITPEAIEAIRKLVKKLQRRSSKKLEVVGHGDVNSTSCPGGKIYKLIKGGVFSSEYKKPGLRLPKPPTRFIGSKRIPRG